MIHEIHITDQKIYNGFPHMLRAVFEIPVDRNDKERIEVLNQCHVMLFEMIDLVASLKVSPSVATKCEKVRRKIRQQQQAQQKAENEDKKIEEMREKERLERERVKRMTPEQQAKYEEKQKKKEQQKMKNKFMKIVK